MQSAALKSRTQVSQPESYRTASDRKAFRLIAQSRYLPPSVASFAIADTVQTGQLSMIGNVGLD